MQQTLEDFSATITTASRQLLEITEAESETRPAPGKWSKKEILGHLIDSASNNHQRFVRVQLKDGLALPGYEQERWVTAQAYQREPWEQIIQLWKNYNLHLLNVMACVPEEKLKHHCTVGDGEPVSLEFLMTDYVHHLQHHLGQIFSGQ